MLLPTKIRNSRTFAGMRVIFALFTIILLLHFSGIPELFAGLSGCETSFVDLNDESDAKEKEDSKEKEKEKEDVKESLLSEEVFLGANYSGSSVEIANRILSESVFYPEDHSPPPELA